MLYVRAKIMKRERPDFVLNYKKPKNTEIKYINGYWYLYERSSYYDSQKKTMHKKSGKILGKITESGFIKAKEKVDHSVFETIDVLELGISGYLYKRNQNLIEKLKSHFPDIWQELFVMSVMRTVEGPRFKRIDDEYETSCLSVLFPNLRLSRVDISSLLKTIGKRRQAIMDFMKDYNAKLSPYVVFDGHRIVSDSKTLDTAQMGYDSKQRFKDQVNLVYAFSVSGQRCFPYYYKQFSGDVPDISAFSSLIDESGLDKKDLTILADKGFGSEDNFTLINDSGFKYIIPIKRTDCDSKDNIPANIDEYDEGFKYNGRAVLHKQIQKEGYFLHVFLDTSLLANELGDFTERLNKSNKTKEMAKEKEEERIKSNKKRRLTDEQLSLMVPVSFKDAILKKTGLGTLTIRSNSTLNGVQIYNLYKRREAIEDFFRSYDCSLDFSSSYMRDSYKEEAWLFLNHLSALMAFDILDEIYIKGKTSEISLKDFISMLERIHVDRVKDKWYLAKITKKREAFANMFDFNISAVVDEMNSISST